MVAAETPTTPTAIARALCRTDDLETILGQLDEAGSGNLGTLKAQLQAAISRRQHLACQLDPAPTAEALLAVCERTAAGIAQLDPNGRFLKVDPRCNDLLGYSAEEFLQLALADLFVRDGDRASLPVALHQLLAGEIQTVTYEKCCRHRDGRELWLHLSLSSMWCPTLETDCILAAIQTLNNRQYPTNDRLVRERQCQAIVDALPSIAFQTDKSGAWTFLNPAWTALLGYDLGESLGANFLHFLEPVSDRMACGEDFRQLVEGRRETVRFEVRCRPKDKAQPPRRLEFLAGCLRDRTGEIVGAAGQLTDITERCQNEDRLRAVIDTVPGLVSWVGRDGSYLGVNKRLADTLQRQPEEFIGKDVGFLNENPAFQHFLASFLGSDDTHTSAILESEVNGTARNYSIAGQKYQQGGAAVLVGIDITESKQAERALRESEEKFRQLAENIEQVFWMLDLARKKMIYVSPAYKGTWGRPLETVYRPQAWMDTVHPDDYFGVLKAIPRQIRGEYDIEYRILRPDGEIRWIRDRAFPVRDESGSVYRLAGIAEDVTERKRAKEALEKRERYLTALVDVQRSLLAAGAGGDIYRAVLPTLGRVSEASVVYAYEVASDRPAVACCLARWEAIGAAPEGAAAGLSERLDCDRLPTDWVTALRRGEIVRGTIDDVAPSDRAFFEGRGMQSVLALPLMVGGCFFGFIGLESARSAQAWDRLAIGLLGSAAGTIALARERQLNQEELQQQLTAIEASTDGIFIVNTAGTLRYVNSSYHRILGYHTVDSLVGQDWRLAYPDAESVAAIESALRIGGKWSGEIVGRHLDGSTLSAELSMTVTHDREIVGVCRDISERKQTEETLKASLEEKELLLKEVHHRVKNNLQVISSLFNLSAHTVADPGALAVLAESQNRIGSMALIHGKLYQSENLSNVDFAEYIRDLVYHLLASYNADPGRIQTEIDVNNIALNLDAAIPCGLLLNELISNALKHGFPDSRSGHLRVNFISAPNRYLLLRVADDGVGLPPNFEPEKCTSLGISLIISLTQQLRGSLEMYNDPGATFEITFPQPVERRRF